GIGRVQVGIEPGVFLDDRAIATRVFVVATAAARVARVIEVDGLRRASASDQRSGKKGEEGGNEHRRVAHGGLRGCRYRRRLSTFEAITRSFEARWRLFERSRRLGFAMALIGHRQG